jgi:2-polyprenyl-3-methyl-5-hydroxy-6-metoxy-1,4-benzoquinol methylase
MNSKYINGCRVCGNTKSTNKHIVDGFHIKQCQHCSLLFVSDYLTSDDLKKYYKKDGVDPAYNDFENIDNLKWYYNKLRDLIENKKKGGRILDVGCSAGHFLDVMYGWNRYGIEFDSEIALKAEEKYGKNIHIGTLEDVVFQKGYFDVITLQDVLDHMIDPIVALNRCHQLLKPNGLIIVKVHNISCLYAKLTRSKFYAIIPPFHLSFFNKKSLYEALIRADFSPLFFKFIAHKIFIKTVFFRLAGTKRSGIFYKLYTWLEHLPLGNISFKKNLHDVITVFAVKKSH